ncbi:hypothetical protein E1B28_002929 [Marasmius oreades]|uniref:Uncharacterized protein n=1 Tax=Marasmius oreades TaxID=181124 RepID=A0A9P7ULN2_9AGAR|nr:uncharacterized protein E1B28_002929 [Marasmius oreades]KAG7085366.1 hypothetical protein E1B28_002929 [Marasmius oreades]
MLEPEEPLPVPLRKLWLVCCQPHKELKNMANILHRCIADNEMAITSLHCRSEGDGILYLDTPDPMKAMKILSNHQAIRRLKTSPYYKLNMMLLEDLMDSVRSLILLPLDSSCEGGTWFPVHEGDLALVTAVFRYSGELGVLLPACHTEYLVNLGVPFRQGDYGRKLLAGKMLPQGGVAPLLDAGLKIEHGLVFRIIKAKCVAPMSGPYDWQDISIFVMSEHPLVAEFFPQIDGLEFLLDEKVESWDGMKKGKVTVVTEKGVDILTDTIPSTHEFLGWKVFKCWEADDYVIAPRLEAEGLVIGTKSNHVYAWLGYENDNDHDNDYVHSTLQLMEMALTDFKRE